MPRLLLITASSPDVRRVRRARVLNFQQITMPYLAARVPPNWDVLHVDEEAEDIDWDIDPDVVGITFHTPSAFHAYDIATRFRSRGACIVMGGPHVTLVPEEAGRFADAIFVGEAEGLWEAFLNGFEAGSCRRVYRRTSPPSLDNIPMARKQLFHRHDHSNGIAVQAGIVFGFDHDTPEIFEDTADFLEKAGVQNATFNILTPFPGTPLFRKMEAEGRILTRDWRRYNSREDVVYQPKQMSAAELSAGFRYANERFYSAPGIAKRLSRSPVQLWWTLPLNLAYGYQWRKTAQAAVPHRIARRLAFRFVPRERLNTTAGRRDNSVSAPLPGRQPNFHRIAAPFDSTSGHTR